MPETLTLHQRVTIQRLNDSLMAHIRFSGLKTGLSVDRVKSYLGWRGKLRSNSTRQYAAFKRVIESTGELAGANKSAIEAAWNAKTKEEREQYLDASAALDVLEMVKAEDSSTQEGFPAALQRMIDAEAKRDPSTRVLMLVIPGNNAVEQVAGTSQTAGNGQTRILGTPESITWASTMEDQRALVTEYGRAATGQITEQTKLNYHDKRKAVGTALLALYNEWFPTNKSKYFPWRDVENRLSAAGKRLVGWPEMVPLERECVQDGRNCEMLWRLLEAKAITAIDV